MTDQATNSPEPAASPAAAGAPRVRRISNPRPKKTAKPAPVPSASAEDAFSVQAPVAPKFPEFTDSPDSPAPRGDWPEPEAASGGPTAAPENPKRKRRRKKGKGNNPQHAAQPVEEESFPLAAAEESEPAAQQAAPSPQQPHPQPVHSGHQPRPRIDPEVVSQRAWKIYLSEVSEEGVALVGDNDAKELARRCFRLAEIFIEEQSRRR